MRLHGYWEGVGMLRNVRQRIATLPAWAKTLLVLAALGVIGLSVLLSPLVMVLAFVVLLVACCALVVCLLNRMPLKRWAIIAATSLVVLLVFNGISNALYFGGQSEQANSQDGQKRTAQPDHQQKPLEKAEKHKGVEQLDQNQQEPEQANAKNDAQPEATGSDNMEATHPPAKVTITEAVDGDTIKISPTVEGKDTVRLIGIDAPEEAKANCGAQPLAQAATAQMANWVGSKAKLEFDKDLTDQYGRLLAYVHVDAFGDIMVNEDMVLGGLAQVYIVPPNTKYEDRLRKAQQEAEEDPVAGIPSMWKLSEAKQDQLADHGNGIGSDDRACPPEKQASPQPKPKPQPNQNNKARNVPNPNASASASPSAGSSASPAGGGSASPAPSGGDLNCSDIGHKVWVGPNDPNNLDEDSDGWGCDSYE
jgi:micrococcal nuclease